MFIADIYHTDMSENQTTLDRPPPTIYIVGSMGKHTPLGEFEVVVLMAVLHVGDEAFGSAIRDDIETRSGRAASRGAVYITLDRLEEKGLLTSALRDGTSARGLRPRRYFSLTRDGTTALRASLDVVTRMHQGLEGALGKLG